LEIGNKGEPTLIQEDQAGSKPISLFLYMHIAIPRNIIQVKINLDTSSIHAKLFPTMFLLTTLVNKRARSTENPTTEINEKPRKRTRVPVRNADIYLLGMA